MHVETLLWLAMAQLASTDRRSVELHRACSFVTRISVFPPTDVGDQLVRMKTHLKLFLLWSSILNSHNCHKALDFHGTFILLNPLYLFLICLIHYHLRLCLFESTRRMAMSDQTFSYSCQINCAMTLWAVSQVQTARSRPLTSTHLPIEAHASPTASCKLPFVLSLDAACSLGPIHTSVDIVAWKT